MRRDEITTPKGALLLRWYSEHDQIGLKPCWSKFITPQPQNISRHTIMGNLNGYLNELAVETPQWS